MHILYKITYLPHIGTSYPKYYIGSKHNYKGNYYGSVSSTQIFEYTNGMELKKWWKQELKYKDNFLFEILSQFEDISPLELVEKEFELHVKLDVLSDEYFNQSIATKGWVSCTNSAQTKQKKSEKTKLYWNSAAGKLKKERLAERNRQTMSIVMREKWKNPTEAMLNAKDIIPGRPKGSKDLKPRKERPVRKIYADGMIFKDAIEASIFFNIHVVNIRRRCRCNYNGNWRYLDEDTFDAQ